MIGKIRYMSKEEFDRFMAENPPAAHKTVSYRGNADAECESQAITTMNTLSAGLEQVVGSFRWYAIEHGISAEKMKEIFHAGLLAMHQQGDESIRSLAVREAQ